MEFQNEFDVKAPLDEVWNTVLDVEKVAPCVPGAEVLEKVSDDAYKVGIKVKVGPVSMQYSGEVEIVERDPSSHRAVMTAKAREARGQGTANANVKMSLSGNGDSTHGSIATEVQLSGRAAAMGQGVIKDVSARIVDQFAENLAAMLGGEPAAGGTAAGGAAAAEAQVQRAEPASAAQGVGQQPAPSAPPAAPPPAASQTDEGLDVLPIVGSIAKERLRDPRVIGGLVLLVLLLLRRRR
jgi:carbon monoxide dehydrogenase subunit G